MHLKQRTTWLALLLTLAMILPPALMPQAGSASPPVAEPPVAGLNRAAAGVQRAAGLLATAPAQPSVPAASPAVTGTLTLRVVNARTEPRAFDGLGVIEGEPITSTYEFMINVDNTGDPFDDSDCFAFIDVPTNTIRNPNYPEGCEWPGVRTNRGWSPIYTRGTQDDLNELVSVELPAGRYLISVLADGYKNGGIHFTIPLADPGPLEVAVHPLPLPPAEMIIKIFDDRVMTNGQFDAPGEDGLAGFRATINDIAGEITTDIFGNPLCSEYEEDGDGNPILDPDGNPIPIPGTGGECLSDADGIVRIPYIGTIRYDVLVVPPDGEQWIQTTTLEGSQGWDTWLQEAGTGLDNEFLIAGEPFPWTIFGFVAPTNTLTNTAETGAVTGVIMAAESYIPSIGGLPHMGDIWGGLSGVKLNKPIAYPWLSLNALQGGDQAVWVGHGNADGSFLIENVPDGDYFLAYWDEQQHYILDWVQLSVQNGELTDVGVRTMVGWFAEWFGTVFLDYNENGRRDDGEPGVPDYLVVLKDRDNTEIDRMSIAAMTDGNGNYALEKGYPMTTWMVLEAYSDIYRTTGVTFQASNQLTETTVLGAGVDVDVLPNLGLWGRLDWGVKFYDPGTNGGIAGSVFFDTVRAEDDARYAGVEPWQPGIPDLEVLLYATVKDVLGNPITSTNTADYGAYVKGPLLARTTTETFTRPKNCVVRDVNGDPVVFPSLPPSDADKDCMEGILMSIQFGTEFATLDGNWGFGEIYTDPVTGAPLPVPQPLEPDAYLVEVVIPDDPVTGRPLFEVTREEDPNIYDGNTYYPTVIPPACAGPLHIVDVEGDEIDHYPLPWDPGQTSTPVHNPGLVDAGGTRFEGQAMPLCNVRLVEVQDRKGIAPSFLLHTPVPPPGRWRGYIIDDLNVSTNPLEMTFGEKVGLKNMPIGLYDFTGRWEFTIHSDFHGVFEVIMPSEATYNIPSPSGMQANMYYIYGNDPGAPGRMNANYNPQYRSIGATFEFYPGVTVPSDLAPTQNGALIWNPASNQAELARCSLADTTPQLFAVSQPFKSQTDPNRLITIQGTGFGIRTPGDLSRVFLNSLDGLTTRSLPIVSWNDREIVIRIPAAIAAGMYELSVRANNRFTTVNGLGFHILGTGYAPTVLEVGDGYPYTTIQSALDVAAGMANPLVVVYPGISTAFTNPLGIYFENPVIYAPVKLQGIGPGGVYTDGTGVLGAVMDGRAIGGDTPYTDVWRALVGDIWLNRGGWAGSQLDGDGNPRIYEGPVVTVFAEDGEFTDVVTASIDGFTIQGGDQQGFPNNRDQNGGAIIPGVPAEVVIQGGGIFVNGYARHLRITNNVIQTNGGAYAGAIRLGTPDVAEPLTDHQNDNIYIGHNRILANGGTNLAGGVGVFAGTENYEIAHNDICGNFSAEYGGGISHYGYSPNGQIHHNRIYFNRSYDEGGGIMIAGELPVDPGILSPGAGPVDIYANLIQANLSNDDGGGVRFLMAGDYAYNVYNNMIVNNVSTHEGGGVSLNDAPQVALYNNTIMKNITTATAMTSNGLAAPSGLATSLNSNLLQATLPVTAPTWSDPVLFNNIFWDNRAGTWTGGGVGGIGLPGDPSPIFYWDLGVAGSAELLTPKYSLLHVQYGAGDPTNRVGLDPGVVEEYDLTVRVYPWRGNPNFIGADIVALDLPANLLGDYHLAPGSPAINWGTAAWDGIAAPNQDYDGHARPSGAGFEAGADERGGIYPTTPILFPTGGAAAQPPAGQGAQAAPHQGLVVWLPLVVKGRGAEEMWAGQPDSFNFDPVAGVEVIDSGYAFWNRAVFGNDQEVYWTFTQVSPTATRQDLLLRVAHGSDGLIGPDSYLIDIGLDMTTGDVEVRTLSPGNVWHTHAVFGGLEFVAGDQWGARATQGGIVELYHNGELLGSVDLSDGPNAWAYNGFPGRVGVWFEGPGFAGPDAASFTNFGGGTANW